MNKKEMVEKIQKHYTQSFTIADHKKGIIQLHDSIFPRKQKHIQPARFVYVPGGEFTMGDDKGDSEEKPAHRVALSPFFMAEFPVTQELYEAITGETPSKFEGHNRPVEQVSWENAMDFCKELNKKINEENKKNNALNKNNELPPIYDSDYNLIDKNGNKTTDITAVKGFRLPTEAEWEYAARGGGSVVEPRRGVALQQYAGSNLLDAVGWYDENSGGETKPVGLKLPNPLGLYDMSGNVWEWCYDWYGNYPKGKQTNPIGQPTGSYRVLRGGSWHYFAAYCRVAKRFNYYPDLRSIYHGFRLGFALV